MTHQAKLEEMLDEERAKKLLAGKVLYRLVFILPDYITAIYSNWQESDDFGDLAHAARRMGIDVGLERMERK